MVLKFEQIVEKIVKNSDLGKEDVLAKVEEKKTKFAGLLTDEGAAYMIAKELDIEMNVEKKVLEDIKINKLKDGMNNLDLLVRVLHVYTPREFEKSGKKGKLCNLLVGDETGEIKLTFWGKDVDALEKKNVQKGSVLLLKNCYTSSYKEQVQLNLGYGGEFVVDPEDKKTETLPKVETVSLKLEDLSEEMQNVDVFARIVRIFPVKEFEKEGEKRKVLNFLINDGSKELRGTAWNNLAEIVEDLNVGDVIKIEGGYTKKGLKELELHLGWNARILKEPVLGFKIPELSELLGEEIKEAKLNELKAGEELFRIGGTIVAVNKGNLHYLICPKCGTTVSKEDEGFLCEDCGQVKEPDINLIATIVLDDGFATINCVLFGKNAEKVLELSKKELKNELEKKGIEEILQHVRNEIIGKNSKLIGKTRQSKLNQEEQEFVVTQVENFSLKEENEKLLKMI